MDTPPDEAFPPPVTSPGTISPTGEELVTEDDIELEDLAARDPEACKRRALQLARKYRRRLRHEEEKLARACRILEAARRNEDAQKREPSTVARRRRPTERGGSLGGARSGARSEGGVALVERGGCGARRVKESPQGEPINKEEGAEEAS